MKTKLIELLNKLIEKGWKPFGIDCIKEVNYVKHHWTLCWYFWWWSYQRWKPIRELVSKESGLWQFVCENGMLNKKRWSNRVRLETSSVWDYIEIWTWEDYGWKFDSDYEYRLIESALKDESEFEEFLLKNIKVE